MVCELQGVAEFWEWWSGIFVGLLMMQLA